MKIGQAESKLENRVKRGKPNCALITSYERDNESDLDFAQARMYGYNHGRFTSPDPLMASALTYEPQTWNRYVYVLNNPLKLIDPTGMLSTHTDEDGNVIAVYNDGDLGVYRHNSTEGWDGQSVLSKEGEGISRMGETEIISEFAHHDEDGTFWYNKETGAMKLQDGGIRINFALNYEDLFTTSVSKAANWSLSRIAIQSRNGGDLDIKKGRLNEGGSFRGKFMTRRSVGNYLAGYLGAVTQESIAGGYLSQDSYLRVAGEYQQKGFLSAAAVSLGANPTVNAGPCYGENPYSCYWIGAGFNAGIEARPKPDPNYRPARVGF